MIGWNQEKITFQQYRENLAKAGVFRWVTNIHMNIKDINYTFDNSLLFTESIQNTTQIFHALNHNVRFLPCQHRGVGIMQDVYALSNPVCIVLIIPGHSRREVPRQAVDIVNPGIQWRFIAPDIHYQILTIWNFNSLFRVCLIFCTYDSANFKKHRE